MSRLALALLLVTLAACGQGGHRPAVASAAGYVHVAACKASLRGWWSDNDVLGFMRRSHSAGFVGWSSHATRGRDGSVFVRGLFKWPGAFHWIRGHCWGGDYRMDSLPG